MLVEGIRNSQAETLYLVNNENQVPLEAGPDGLVLVREVQDVQAVGGKHAGAVWRTRQNLSQIPSRSSLAIGSENHRLKEEMTVRTQTQNQTPQYQMPTITTSLPSPVNKPQPSRPQTCDRCSIALLGAVCSLMCQHLLELEVLFGDHGVFSGVITDSLVFERTVYSLTGGFQAKRSPLLLDLVATSAFSIHVSEFALQTLDLTHVWSTRNS